MFFKQQECTGRWVSVESEAVCKTAKIQTRNDLVPPRWLQYKRAYCMSWKSVQAGVKLWNVLCSKGSPRQPATTSCPNPTTTADSKRRASKVSLSTACPFLCHLFLTLIRGNPPSLGSTRWLQTLCIINSITDASEGRQCNASDVLKGFPAVHWQTLPASRALAGYATESKAQGVTATRSRWPEPRPVGHWLELPCAEKLIAVTSWKHRGENTGM